ncbi:MAG TPA: hypothetical protein VK756_02015 [Solirubrobacteraceae bacterium]|nr:hypothetical protein [Solirubrobacteraceae bacterium]
MVLAVACLSTPAAASAAGTYEVRTCNYNREATNNSWVWSSSDTSPQDDYTEHSSCPYRVGGDGGQPDQESGLATTDTLHLSSGAPPGSNAGWTFTAPPGTTITAISYEGYLGHYLDGNNYWSSALRADGTIIGKICQDTIQNGERCYTGAPPGEGGEIPTITGLNAHTLSFGIDCLAPEGEICVTGASEYSAWAALYGAAVTISERLSRSA